MSINVVVPLVFFVFFLGAGAVIVSKAGYHWAWVLILVIPVVGFVMLYLFALSEWPIRRELEDAQSRLAGLEAGPERWRSDVLPLEPGEGSPPHEGPTH